MDKNEIEQGINEIRRLARLLITEFGPQRDGFGFNPDSVEWIEGFIERERGRRDLNRGVPEGLVNTLGSFLGECIVAATGGKWGWNEKQDDWGVEFASGGMAFPFVKVSKQLANGLESGDSIVRFYEITTKYVATGKLWQQEGES